MAVDNVRQSNQIAPMAKRRDAGPALAQDVLMPAHECWYPPAVEMGDVLRVDFTRKTVGPAGHYLIQIQDANGDWRGCRHFRRHEPTERLEMDVSGAGEWRSVNSLADLNIEVVGYVAQIYKPAEVNAALGSLA